MDVRAGRWLRIWRGESKPLATNATGDAWRIIGPYREHTTSEYVWRQVNVLVVHQDFYCQLSSVGHVCYNGTLLKVIMQWIRDGSRRRGRPRKWRNGKASHWCRCSTSQTTDVAEQASQPRCLLSEYPNDARASRELVSIVEQVVAWPVPNLVACGTVSNWNLPVSSKFVAYQTDDCVKVLAYIYLQYVQCPKRSHSELWNVMSS